MNREQAAQKICQVCHKLWQRGFVAANDGNVSVKLADGTILATPTGVSKGEVTPDMLVLVDLDGNVLQSGSLGPSSELKMHLRCYQQRPDVAGVVHAHSPAATAFAAAGLPLNGRFLTEALMTLGEVPLASFAMPGTEQVPESIAELIIDHDAVLLQNHGALTLGKDVWEAYLRMESVEHFAQISLNVRLLGGGVELKPDDVRALRRR